MSLDPKHKVQYQKGMANVLPTAKRAQILGMLCEGMSMRAASRLAGVSINTVTKLLEDAGEACLKLHDDKVWGVAAQQVQCDEIWSYCYAKARNVADAKAAPEGAGDVWTWTAIDAKSKLMIAYFVGDRSQQSANILLADVRLRTKGRAQITTDGHASYLHAVLSAYGKDVDFAQLVKSYGTDPTIPPGRYSPPICTGARAVPVAGAPDPAHISTSYVERSNLSIRMQNRRFTRLTNAFSKKFANHVHMLALYFAFYNFCRVHKALKATPAMAAGLTGHAWTLESLIGLVDANAPKLGPRGPYKKGGA